MTTPPRSSTSSSESSAFVYSGHRFLRTPTTTKHCSGCNRSVLKTNFHKCSANRDGLQNQCIKCIEHKRKVRMAKKELPTGKTKEELMAQRKECQRCHFVKTGLSFYRDKKIEDGLQNWCKQCHRVMDLRLNPKPRK